MTFVNVDVRRKPYLKIISNTEKINSIIKTLDNRML